MLTYIVARNMTGMAHPVDGNANVNDYCFPLPAGWAGRTLTIRIFWFPADGVGGNVRWLGAVGRLVAVELSVVG